MENEKVNVDVQNNANTAKKNNLDYEKQFLNVVDAAANGFIGFLGAVLEKTVEKLNGGNLAGELAEKISDGLSKPINDAAKAVKDELEKI